MLIVIKAKKISITFTLLMVNILLLGYGYVFAQDVNTGAGPYLNSWHTYRVIVGSTSNTIEWDITEADGTTVINDFSPEPDWANIHALSGSNADISIFFNESVFTTGNTYYLRYSEFTGSETCVAARRFEINITENDFYLTLSPDIAECKQGSGNVEDWDIVGVNTREHDFDFTVTLHKDEDFTISGWSFQGNISLTPVGHNHNIEDYTVSVYPLTEGTATLIDAGTVEGDNYDPEDNGFFKVNVGGLTTPDLDSVNVLVAVTLSGLMHEGVTATLTLDNGYTTHGVNDNRTLDNTDRPTPVEQPVAALRDRQQVVVLNPLPATKNILPGAGETASSAANPLQNSTHRYVVELGDFGNVSRANTDWHITTQAAPNTQLPETDFSITRNDNGTSSDTAIVVFDELAEGDYYLYFTEESSNGCTALRRYPFTIHPPLDIDLFVADAQCPYYSGRVNTPDTNTGTTIGDTVRIVSGYTNDWQFDFEITSAPEFNSSDVEITGVNVPDGALSNLSIGTITTGTVNVTDNTIDKVVINVTYNGLYIDAHTINVNITNITGSFNEQDADATNSGTHIINALPQPGTLAGVD